MKVFLVGDYRTGTGPANVTLQYKNRIENVSVQKMRSKAGRMAELLIKIPFCDVVLLSGHSKQNLYAIDLAHFFHKKAAFLMHGCVEHENAINGVPDDGMSAVERETLKKADAIYAVSGQFANWLGEKYPGYRSKISAVPNGVELKKDLPRAEKIPHRILSIGGGMPRKQIRYIAQAVMKLREDPGFEDTELIVIGDQGADTDAINAFPCVTNLGLVPYEKAMELLAGSALFVQNSCFETFGLAPVEALERGASVLLSTKIGALEILHDVQEQDLIRDEKDPEEIAEKIKNLLQQGNRDRLYTSIDTESASWDKRCSLLMKKLQELTKE